MQRNKYFSSIAFALVALFTLSCGISSSIQPSSSNKGSSESLSNKEIINHITRQYPEQERFRASGRATLHLKDKNINSKIEFTLVKGKGIRLVANPFPFVIAGRAWITPHGITVTDAINKRYITATYSELQEYIGMELSYHAFEALFLDKLFKIDGSSITPSDLLVSTDTQNNNCLLSYKDKTKMEYVSAINNDWRPHSISIYDPGNKYRLSTTYTSFSPTEYGNNLPVSLILQVFYKDQPQGSLSIDLTKVKFTNVQESDIEPKVNTSSYEQMSLESLSLLF